jgi:hypothetical protein
MWTVVVIHARNVVMEELARRIATARVAFVIAAVLAVVSV